MTNLQNLDEVKALQSNLRASLDTPQGHEVIAFLEQVCGWYDFAATDPDLILIGHGKRQVLATLKTLLKLSAEEIVVTVSNQGE